MPEPALKSTSLLCQACGQVTKEGLVDVTIWKGDRLVVVERVPARVCQTCQEQYYEEDISAKILRLAHAGFPNESIVREITVPVFALDNIP
jgi:YgiT-type zinc finger domain-containing protein